MKKIIVVFVSFFLFGCSDDVVYSSEEVKKKRDNNATELKAKQTSSWVKKMDALNAKALKKENLENFENREKKKFKRTLNNKLLPPPTTQTIDLK